MGEVERIGGNPGWGVLPAQCDSEVIALFFRSHVSRETEKFGYFGPRGKVGSKTSLFFGL